MTQESTESPRKVRVFRDSPVWGTTEKWWMIDYVYLAELAICEYDCSDDDEEFDAQLLAIRADHPGCVYVY